MARFSFGIFGQGTDELLAGMEISIKNASNTIVATTSHSSQGSSITDNNDGTYYVDGLAYGLYSVYVGSSSVVQEELNNIWFGNEDVTTHLDNTTKHRTINDSGTGAYNLFSASKIISSLALKADDADLTSHTGDAGIHREIADTGTSATVLFSASKIISSLALKADDADLTSHTGDADKHREINDLGTGVTDLWSGSKIMTYVTNKATFSSDDFAGGLGSDVTIKQDFNDQTFLDNTKRLNQNLETLQSYLVAMGGGSNLLCDVQHSTHLTANATNHGKIYYYNSGPEANAGTFGLYFIASGANSTYERLTIVEETWGGGGGN